MSKMNPNEKKENASKNENVNNEEATNLQEEQSNRQMKLPALTMCRARWKPCKRNITN